MKQQPRRENVEKTSAEIADDAQNWLILLQSDDASEFDQRRFQVWLGEDARHVEAYQELKESWVRIAELKDTPMYTALRSSVRPSISNRVKAGFCEMYNLVFRSAEDLYDSFSVVKLSAVALVLLLGVFSFSRYFDRSVETQSYLTKRGEILEFTLSDGSALTLGADSQLEVSLSKHERRVTLGRGQAFFKVAKNRQKPFVVTAGEMQVRVIGTSFDLNRTGGAIQLSVSEGVVEVSKRVVHKDYQDTESRAQLTLTHGQAISAKNNPYSRFSTITDIDPAEVGAWRSGRLIFDNAELSTLVEAAQRYYPATITISNEALSSMKVTASFRTEEVEKVLGDIALVLPIKLYKDADSNLVISPKKSR